MYTKNISKTILNSWPEDVLHAYNKSYNTWYKPYDIQPPDNVISAFNQAASVDNIEERIALLDRAAQKAEIMYFGAWRQGLIKKEDKGYKPMPEDVKARLKEINAKKRAEKSKIKKLYKGGPPESKPSIQKKNPIT